MSNEAGKEIGGFIDAMGPAMSELGQRMAERDAQRDTHEWKKQPDGTSKWMPKDPAAGRPRVGGAASASAATPAGTDDAPASGIPVPPSSRLASVRGGQADTAKYGGRVVLPSAKRPRPTFAVGEGNNPEGMKRPCSCTGPNCNCG
jgi:hypothetical protein